MREFYVFFCFINLIITTISRVKCDSVIGDRGNCLSVSEVPGNEKNATLASLTVGELQLDNFESLKNVSFHNVTFTNVTSSSKIGRSMHIQRLKWPGMNASALRVAKPFLCQLPFRQLIFDDYLIILGANSCMTYDRIDLAGEARTKPVGKLSLRRRLSLSKLSPQPPSLSINVTLGDPNGTTSTQHSSSSPQLSFYSYRPPPQYLRPIPPSPVPSFCPTADALYEPICPHNATTGSGAAAATVYTPVLGGFSYNHIVLYRARGGNQHAVKNNIIWSCPTWHRSVCITAPKFNCTMTWIYCNEHTSPMSSTGSSRSTSQTVTANSTTQGFGLGSTTQNLTPAGFTTQSVSLNGSTTTVRGVNLGSTTHTSYPGLLTRAFYPGVYPGWTTKSWYPAGWTYRGVYPTGWYPGWTTWGRPIISFWLPKSRETEDLKRIYEILNN